MNTLVSLVVAGVIGGITGGITAAIVASDNTIEQSKTVIPQLQCMSCGEAFEREAAAKRHAVNKHNAPSGNDEDWRYIIQEVGNDAC